MKHTVSIGDEIIVRGYIFIVTGIKTEMDKPAVLTTKQPIELLDFDRSPLTGISVWGR